MSTGTKRYFVFLVSLLAFAQPAIGIGWSVQKDVAASAIIKRFFDGLPDAIRPPSGSIGVVVNGRVVFRWNMGNTAPGVPVNSKTLYRIGSLTKQFTAATILKLIEKDATVVTSGAELDLDTNITSVLGIEQAWSTRNQNPITVRALLTMTSNLPNFTRTPPSTLDPWGQATKKGLLKEFRRLAPSGWPSTFEYSNTNYFLLSAIADNVVLPGEKAATFEAFVNNLVLKAAGTRQTGHHGQMPLLMNFAVPTFHRRPAFFEPDWLRGSGDMISNVDDMMRWNIALMQDKILSKQNRRLMFTEFARVSPRGYYGTGWFITSRNEWLYYSHSGALPGYSAFNAIAESKKKPHWTSVTVLTNSDGIDDLDILADDLVQLAKAPSE